MVVIPMRRRRRERAEEAVIAAFEAAQAIDHASAKSLVEMGLSEDDQFRQLAEAGLFREPVPGRWYLDPDAVADFRDDRRRRMLVAVIVAVLAAGLAGWLVYRHP